MSIRSDIASSVLERAVKFDMPPFETAQFIQEILNNVELDTDNPYTIRNLIDLANFQFRYYKCIDRDAYNRWINKYQFD